ncbi:MAG: RNA polymerase sigma factor [Bacteroidales bacterium]
MAQKDLYSDLELWEGCKKNQRKYQELLYRKYAKKMYALCLSYAKERTMAQDILQDGFVKVFRHIKTYKAQGSLEGWIRKIITNTALDHLRQKSKQFEYIDQNKDIEEEKFEKDILEKINTDGILAKVAQLPNGARVVFNLYALEGYTHREIANKLDITEGTSKSQYKRARAMLQEMIKDYY